MILLRNTTTSEYNKKEADSQLVVTSGEKEEGRGQMEVGH